MRKIMKKDHFLLKRIPGAFAALLVTASAVLYWFLNIRSMSTLLFEKLKINEIDREILTTTGYPTWKSYIITYFLMLATLIALVSVYFALINPKGRGSTMTMLCQLFSLGFMALIYKSMKDGKSKFLYDKKFFLISAALMAAALVFSTVYALLWLLNKKKISQAKQEKISEKRQETKIVVLDKCTLTVGDIDFSPIDALGNTEYYDILTKEEIIEKCADAQVILCNKAVIDDEIMTACPKLEYIGLFATGYNNIDTAAAKKHGVTVCNAPGYSTDSVAQLVFAYILSYSTSLDKYNKSTHDGEWIRSSAFSYFPYPITELKDKKLGVIGYGAIGRKVASIGAAFGMRVYVASRRQPEDCPYNVVTVDEIFKVADFLTVHCPLTEQTRGLINEERLSSMKKTAYLINTSRGAVCDEAALKKALDEGVIAGAAVDVLTAEPMKEDNPLIGAKNLTITPHIAWASYEARARLILLVAGNLRAYQNGQPKNTV